MEANRYEIILKQIESAQRESAALMLQARGILAETKTGRRDVVTEYDRRVQALLMDRLGKAVPGAHFFCEEMQERDRLDSDALFIIDPIDGTMNFVHGFHHSCISVAYAEKGRLMVGAVYNPYVDELFTAIKGQGARLNGSPIHVADGGLGENVVVFGTAPYCSDLADLTFSTAKKLFLASLDLRREGSAALDLCTVAAGRAGLYFELQVSLWDYAAGVLIVQEAGGKCAMPDGAPLPLDESKPGIIAGSPQIIQEYLNLR